MQCPHYWLRFYFWFSDVFFPLIIYQTSLSSKAERILKRDKMDTQSQQHKHTHAKKKKNP